jgi:hypothetical protein
MSGVCAHEGGAFWRPDRRGAAERAPLLAGVEKVLELTVFHCVDSSER